MATCTPSKIASSLASGRSRADVRQQPKSPTRRAPAASWTIPYPHAAVPGVDAEDFHVQKVGGASGPVPRQYGRTHGERHENRPMRLPRPTTNPRGPRLGSARRRARRDEHRRGRHRAARERQDPELKNSAVKPSAKIGTRQLTSPDIADGSVSSADVRNGTLRRVD